MKKIESNDRSHVDRCEWSGARATRNQGLTACSVTEGDLVVIIVMNQTKG